jgi:nucleotide-binding universal stress UspA family protein
MLKKILVPLDGSGLAEKALPYAEALGHRFEAELILLWVLHPLVVMSDYGAHTYETLIKLEKQEAQTYLALRQIDLVKKGLTTRVEILEGPAAEQIIDLACRDMVDVIVMCTHGRSGLKRWVFGSVAAKVLQHAPCPVFLVKAAEKDCPSSDE